MLNKTKFQHKKSSKRLIIENLNENYNIDNFQYLFKGFFAKYIKINNFYKNKRISLYGMFMKCRNLVKIELNFDNTKFIKDMESMFMDCENLRKVYLNFDINIINIPCMFENCYNLLYTNIKIVKKSSITYEIFENCKSLRYINKIVSGLCSNGLFYKCKLLKYITIIYNDDCVRIPSFNTTFYECDSLKYLYISIPYKLKINYNYYANCSPKICKILYIPKCVNCKVYIPLLKGYIN